jgi:hypothetical protein
MNNTTRDGNSKHYTKKERYSILKLVIRILTLGIAIAALVISLQNKRDIKWIENVQDNVIEKVLFPNTK